MTAERNVGTVLVGVTQWDDPAFWYEVMNPWGASDAFYLELVLGADSVLDVGCGTGLLLRRAREAGHIGRLCGLDPDPAMLRQAQSRSDIEWVLADAASARWDREFDLVVMTGHAFQQLISDDEIRRSLGAIHAALVDGGRFAFDTRNPNARAWDRWNTSFEVRNTEGEVAVVRYQVDAVEGDLVRLSEGLSGRWWDDEHVSHGELRFFAPDVLSSYMDEAGFVIEGQLGDWQRSPFTPASEEIVTIARRQ